jgi:hypothetical protein
MLIYRWLGWSANLQPAATLFASLYKQAGSPAYVRGLATNVANYKYVRPVHTIDVTNSCLQRSRRRVAGPHHAG